LTAPFHAGIPRDRRRLKRTMAEAYQHFTGNHPNRAFATGFVLNLGFVILEGLFGIISGSMALLADAGHNLMDVLALILAWGASILSGRPPSERRTYGWRRASILAALANAFMVMVVVGGIAWESIQRLGSPPMVPGKTIVWVALIGLGVNSLTALFFAAGRKTDLNIRGVFIHMAADAGVSAGVVLTGAGILLTGWAWLDPAVSLGIGAVILISTWGLFRDAFNMAMDAVPGHIDAEAVRQYLCTLPGVMAVHDLHIWALSTQETALTAHLVKPDPSDDDALIKEAVETLHRRFGISHVTLQWEREADTYQCDLPGRDSSR